MKKLNYLSLISGLLLAGAITSCSENNDGPEIGTVDTVSGFYTINSGNMSGNIPGSITAYNYTTGVSTPALQDAFMTANGIALGEGAQPALIYCEKM